MFNIIFEGLTMRPTNSSQPYPLATRQAALKLKAAGKSYREIQNILGCAKFTVWKWAQNVENGYGLQPNRRRLKKLSPQCGNKAIWRDCSDVFSPEPRNKGNGVP